jgi:hypothetical protein
VDRGATEGRQVGRSGRRAHGLTAPAPRDRPSFDEVFDRVRSAGEASATSSRGTEYSVTAVVARDRPQDLHRPPAKRQVQIHEDTRSRHGRTKIRPRTKLTGASTDNSLRTRPPSPQTYLERPRSPARIRRRTDLRHPAGPGCGCGQRAWSSASRCLRVHRSFGSRSGHRR